mgnify:CR=1 FL=1
MSDLRTLFHEPSLLNKNELSQMRWKISVQSNMPYLLGVSSGITMAVLDSIEYE